MSAFFAWLFFVVCIVLWLWLLGLRAKHRALLWEYEKEQQENTILRFRLVYTDFEMAKWRKCARMSKPQAADTGLGEKDIKALLSLCHPDKHNNSQLATRMTQRLLEMRNGR